MLHTMNFMIRLLGKNKLVKKQGLFIGLSAFFLIAFFVSSCSNPAGWIGVAIQPEDSKLNLRYTDTAEIIAYSNLEDSIRTDFLSRNTIGSVYDPVFGITTAGVYVQFVPESAKQDFGSNRQLDSLVLQFKNAGYYGDTTTELTFHTYEMEEQYFFDSTYYSNSKFAISPTDYSNYSFYPTPNDSSVVDGDTITPVLRIPLNNNSALGQYLLDATVEEMEDIDSFLEYFYGLFIVAEPESVPQSGSLLFYDILSSLSKMTLYYRNTGEDGQEDTLRFSYLVPSFAGRVNRYSHHYDLADPAFQDQVLPPADTTLGQNTLYIQGFAGVRIFINIPNMKNWNDHGKVAINEAKLVIPGKENDPLWGAPRQLMLYELDEEGNYQILKDAGEGEIYFGGAYRSNSYTFRITRYLQSLIDDSTKVNYGLVLFNRDPWINPQRFIIEGTEPTIDSSARVRLQILYTLLEE